MPTTELSAEHLSAEGTIGILDLMTACGLAATKSEARRLVQQGGVTVDEEKISGIDVAFSEAQLQKGLKIRKGKKVYHKAILK